MNFPLTASHSFRLLCWWLLLCLTPAASAWSASGVLHIAMALLHSVLISPCFIDCRWFEVELWYYRVGEGFFKQVFIFKYLLVTITSRNGRMLFSSDLIVNLMLSCILLMYFRNSSSLLFSYFVSYYKCIIDTSHAYLRLNKRVSNSQVFEILHGRFSTTGGGSESIGSSTICLYVLST